MIDPIRMGNTDAKNVSRLGYESIGVLQNYPDNEQVVGVAMMFLILCEVHNIDPQQAFTITKNIMADPFAGKAPALRAFKMYAEETLGGS